MIEYQKKKFSKMMGAIEPFSVIENKIEELKRRRKYMKLLSFVINSLINHLIYLVAHTEESQGAI